MLKKIEYILLNKIDLRIYDDINLMRVYNIVVKIYNNILI